MPRQPAGLTTALTIPDLALHQICMRTYARHTEKRPVAAALELSALSAGNIPCVSWSAFVADTAVYYVVHSFSYDTTAPEPHLWSRSSLHAATLTSLAKSIYSLVATRSVSEQRTAYYYRIIFFVVLVAFCRPSVPAT